VLFLNNGDEVVIGSALEVDDSICFI